MERKDHWETVYQTKSPTEVSWYEPTPEKSLELITKAGISHEQQIIDVGGGASTLVDCLLAESYSNVTVLDISANAIATAQERLGNKAGAAKWLIADITTAPLAPQSYDLWHDRAVFHFLTNADDRRRYIELVNYALKPGGHIIVATFAPDGPTKCSGLEVSRYAPEELHSEFGENFKLMHSEHEQHHTPFGTEQSFIYCYCIKKQ